jgi:hypothetical protein
VAIRVQRLWREGIILVTFTFSIFRIFKDRIKLEKVKNEVSTAGLKVIFMFWALSEICRSTYVKRVIVEYDYVKGESSKTSGAPTCTRP